jgi:Tfp pilus assembly protein PilO
MTGSLKKIHLACLAALTVTVLLTSGLGGVHLLGKWRQIREENNVVSKHWTDLNRAETNLQQLTALLGETRRQLSLLNERIPETAEMGTFIKQLQIRISARDILLLNLVPMPAVEKQQYKKVPIKIELRGSFVNIFQLLQDLETMRRIIRVEDLNILKSEAGNECIAKLTACVFERS